MARFRKRDSEVEAFIWTGDRDQTEEPEWIVRAIKRGRVFFNFEGTPNCRMMVCTSLGIFTAEPGDYVVRDWHGMIMPVRPDRFKELYEEIKEEEIKEKEIINMAFYLGDMTVTQIEQRLGITLTDEERKYLEERHQGPTDKIGPDQWHCFDIPFIIQAGSMKLASEINTLLLPYAKQMKAQIQIGTKE